MNSAGPPSHVSAARCTQDEVHLQRETEAVELQSQYLRQVFDVTHCDINLLDICIGSVCALYFTESHNDLTFVCVANEVFD